MANDRPCHYNLIKNEEDINTRQKEYGEFKYKVRNQRKRLH